MTISNKIVSTCAVLVGFTLALGTAALVTVHRLDATMERIAEDALPGIYLIDRAESMAKDISGRMLMHIASSTPAEKAQFESDIAGCRDRFANILKEYEKTVSRAHDRELFVKIQPAFERYMSAWATVRGLKNQEALSGFRASVLPAFQELQKAIGDEVADNKDYGQIASADAGRAVSTGRWSAWVLLALSIMCGGVLAFYIVQNVNATLNRSVEEIGEGANQVASAATQVASSSQALAQGASEQASSLEETSASTNEISSMTHQNADNSRRAAEAVERANTKVAEANQTLDEMVASMSQINESSQKISKIIKVIDEIAFQTNILALNAAVEAARAGEAGMGFAVVADEVRNLAQRSAQAAKDTAALIEESVQRSTEGSGKLNQVAEAIRGITQETVQVKTLVDEVSAASGEQSRGMDQIGKAIVEMEQITQRNAASSEESASASEELSAQAEHMKRVVHQLRALVDSKAV